MGQTKKRKKSKHRGNAAGMVEARGRTGRKLTIDERKKAGAKVTRDDVRQERARQPPTWKGSFLRGAFAASIFVIVLIALLGNSVLQALTLGVFVMVFYVPLGYYTDTFLYDRRRRKERERSRR